MADYFLSHPFGPFYSKDSKILILGSFPSPKSRESDFYYGHKENRFWKILSFLFDEKLPLSVLEKKEFLKKNKIALYDAIFSLNIKGASDASIRKAKPTNLSVVLDNSEVRHIFCNGKTAYQYCLKSDTKGLPVTLLPSSSSANASYSLDALIKNWRIILEK